MKHTPRELSARLALVRLALERTAEPLHVPLGIVFRPLDGESHLRSWADHAARAGRGETFAPATLYVNVPFCARVCTYCLLSAVRVPGRDFVASYVAALRAHVAMMKPLVEPLRFGSVHIGGGTPTLLTERQLDELLGDVLRLPLADGARIGVEAHPATSTRGRLEVLRRHGVHRLSFGVETLTPAVLRNVNREDQTDARVRGALTEARRLGFEVNVDLLAGLPGETEETFDATVRAVLALEPDSLSVNRFLGENSPLAAFGYGPNEEENRRTDRMLLGADARIREVSPPRWPEATLDRPGFGTQYVWDRSTAARRYFQDDMIGPVSTLAIGHGALGHVYGRHYSVPAGTIAEYVAALDRGAPPEMMSCPVDERFEMAFFVADQASRGDLSVASFTQAFRRDLATAFGPEMSFLLHQGLLTAQGERIAKPPRLDFQATHLLAFLLRDGRGLAREVRALERAELSGGPTDVDVEIAADSDLESIVAHHANRGAKVLRIDVGEGLDADMATRLSTAGRERGLVVDVRSDARRAIREYAHARTEIPPSMLWVRIAIRASQSARGEQRLLVMRAAAGRQGYEPR